MNKRDIKSAFFSVSKLIKFCLKIQTDRSIDAQKKRAKKNQFLRVKKKKTKAFIIKKKENTKRRFPRCFFSAFGDDDDDDDDDETTENYNRFTFKRTRRRR